MMYLSTFVKRLIDYPHERQNWFYASTGGVSLFIGFLGLFVVIFFVANLVAYNNETAQVRALRMQFQVFEDNQGIIAQYDQTTQKNPQLLAQFQKKKMDQPMKLDDMKAYLLKIQKSLKINVLNATYGKVEIVDSAKKLSKIRVSIDLKTLQDRSFFQLVDKLAVEAPALCRIENFQLKRVSALTKEMLKQIQDVKNVLFEGKIEFDWIFINGEKTAA